MEEQEQQESVLLPFSVIMKMSFDKLRDAAEHDSNISFYIFKYLRDLDTHVNEDFAFIKSVLSGNKHYENKQTREELISIISGRAHSLIMDYQMPISYFDKMSEARLVDSAMACVFTTRSIIDVLREYFCNDHLLLGKDEKLPEIEDNMFLWREEGKSYIKDALRRMYDHFNGNLWYNPKTKKLQQKCKPSSQSPSQS